MDAAIVVANNDKDPKNVQVSGVKFVRVSTTRPIPGGARRGKPNVLVARSGRSVCNVEGTEVFDLMAASQGVNPLQCTTDFGVNEEDGMLRVYIRQPNTPGTMPVKRTKSNCVIHLAGVFHDFPNMQVRGNRECAITADVDEDGVRCLVIRLAAGVTKAKGSRKAKSNGGTASPAQTEGTDQSQSVPQAKGPDQAIGPDQA
jgi:hypothetical protein